MFAPATVWEAEAVDWSGMLVTAWMHPPAISSVSLTATDEHAVQP